MNQFVEYPEGMDIEWLAVDRRGHVGVFTTAGCGPIPTVYLQSANTLDQVWDVIRSLPEVSDYHLLVTLPRPDDFISFARRGLFSYDWSDAHLVKRDATNRYQLQARPLAPVTVDSLHWPTELRDVLARVRSVAFDFDDIAIDVTSALVCAAEPAVAPVPNSSVT